VSDVVPQTTENLKHIMLSTKAIRHIFLTFLTCGCGSEARGNLSPHQRVILESNTSQPIDKAFSFDAPAGPQFTALEKQQQIERGKLLLPMVRKAFEEGAETVRIPPGDYRFGQEHYEGSKVIYPLGFENLQRDPEHPLIIDATGVTLWFDLDDAQMPPGHRCLGFRNCRNIVLRGATLDRGTRGCIEGRITEIDREGNRFEIQPSAGISVPSTYKGGEEQRVLPFKSDGRFCAALYDLQPGIRKLRYRDITPSRSGRYWVNMRDTDLMERIHDPNWERACGELGVLRVGDGISCIYTSAGAIALEDSANVTLQSVSVYVAKGGPSEIGGDGAHLWKDCYFGPRPGTSQWKGADGYLSRSTRFGSTLDHVTIRHTADDLQNFHGIWGKVSAVSRNRITLEKNASLRPTLINARPGDRLRFIHRKTGEFLGEAKLTSLEDFQLTIDREATPFLEAQAEWLDHECAGWLVQNCDWEDNFQRLLIMSGPGTVRGCSFTRMGSNISLNTGMGLVGGIPSDITIEDNRFVDVSPRPKGSAIDAYAHNAQGTLGVPAIERLIIRNNLFVRTGGAAIRLAGIKDSSIVGNRFESCPGATLLARPNEPSKRYGIELKTCASVEISSTIARDTAPSPLTDQVGSGDQIGLEDCTNITLNGRQIEEAPEKERPRKLR
jgi:hypothetical protein